LRFSRDGRFILYDPARPPKATPNHKRTVRLLDVASGKDSPWLEDPADSIEVVSAFGEDGSWVAIAKHPPGSQGSTGTFIVPWREAPVPAAEWIEVPVPADVYYNVAIAGNYFVYLQGSKMMVYAMDPATRSFGQPRELKWPAGAPLYKAENSRLIRGEGLVYDREEATFSSWLMKLPQ
jgi:hypothetical protein